MKETFQWIKGLEGLYKVSNHGNVKSYLRKRKQLIKPIKMANGIDKYPLRINGQRKIFTLDELY